MSLSNCNIFELLLFPSELMLVLIGEILPFVFKSVLGGNEPHLILSEVAIFIQEGVDTEVRFVRKVVERTVKGEPERFDHIDFLSICGFNDFET
jgi:hypothetical protein